MDTNTINKRIFTIAGRDGKVIRTDSKQKANGKGSLKKFFNENGDTQMASLEALIDLLTRMPQGVTFDYSIAILLPRTISFLAYEETRNHWISTGAKKNGEPIADDLLAKVKELDTLIKAHGKNIQLFNQARLTSPLYKMYRTETWNVLNKMVPREEGEVVHSADIEF